MVAFSNKLHLLHYGQANKSLNFGEVIQKVEFWYFLWTFIFCHSNI